LNVFAVQICGFWLIKANLFIDYLKYIFAVLYLLIFNSVMAYISQLLIYPVKSLGGIPLKEASITTRGLNYDRRWMLVDEKNQFMSQRSLVQLALFDLALQDNGLLVTYRPTGEIAVIPFAPNVKEVMQVTIWDDECLAACVDYALDEWFSQILKIKCRLVYMADDSLRPVDPRYAGPGYITSFADAYPTLIISEASLQDLNCRLRNKVTMEQFRPNIVIAGTSAYQEDYLLNFEIAGINFKGVKPCARCIMIGINPLTAVTSTEPQKTLSEYRKVNNKIYFGQNLISDGEGTLTVGDQLNIIQLGVPIQFDAK
jgi:uncharacterized protein YcbX